MLEEDKSHDQQRAVIISILVGIVVILLTGLIAYNHAETERRSEIISTTDNYIAFQYALTSLLDYNTTLLEGFIAYVQVNPDLTADQAYGYLERLTQKNMSDIRNIGILKDTTIIYNFPIEGNEASIGIDLAKVEGQREAVLRTKNEHLRSFTGPVDLVQGGKGFIIRLPINLKNGNYWGQISIVLRAEQILNKINTAAMASQLTVLITGDKDEDLIVYGNPNLLQESPIDFKIISDIHDWRIYVVPEGGWRSHLFEIIVIIIVGIGVGVFIALLIYYILMTNYQLKYTSTHDQLTKLYNRHFLEQYQPMMSALADRNQHLIGVIIMDIDKFKRMNDDYGHKFGDAVLICTARLLRTNLRANEAIFRIGGDEFMVIIPEMKHATEVDQVKDRINKIFEGLQQIEGRKIKITPSIGTAIYPIDGMDFDNILHKADQRMYQDKMDHQLER